MAMKPNEFVIITRDDFNGCIIW